MVSKNILPESLSKFYGTNLTLKSAVDHDTFGKVTKYMKHDSQEVSQWKILDWSVNKTSFNLRLHDGQMDRKSEG